MPAKTDGKIPFSDRTLSILVQGWKVGKAALGILLTGVICIIAAFALVLHSNQTAAFTFLGLGAIIIGFVVYHFVFEMIIPAKRATEKIEQNAEVLDLVQTTTPELTEIIIALNDFSLMHADQIVEYIQKSRPYLAKLPFGADLAAEKFLKKPDQFARKIHEIAATSRVAVADISDSIKKSDLARIRQHLESLQHLKVVIERELSLQD
jgi:hypothetical protein